MSTSTSDIRDLLERGLAEIGPPCPNPQLEALTVLATELERWGARINLTGHRDAETIARRLILDAAALLASVPAFASLADLGSGAGFPGLPMAVLCPDRQFVLVESRERRHFFQRDMVRKLSLENVSAVLGRFNEVEPSLCDAVIAQAVASPAALLAELQRWAAPGGLILVPGGVEHRDAGDGILGPGKSIRYRVPLEGPDRTVWIGRRPA